MGLDMYTHRSLVVQIPFPLSIDSAILYLLFVRHE